VIEALKALSYLMNLDNYDPRAVQEPAAAILPYGDALDTKRTDQLNKDLHHFRAEIADLEKRLKAGTEGEVGMYFIDRLPQTQTRFETPSQPDAHRIPLHSLEGTIQRVNYRTRELRLIAEGRPFQFSLSADCRLWFNGRIAPFRCFQPLDHIRVHFVDDESRLIAKGLYLWEEEPIV
jgi:hypothetical protein